MGTEMWEILIISCFVLMHIHSTVYNCEDPGRITDGASE